MLKYVPRSRPLYFQIIPIEKHIIRVLQKLKNNKKNKKKTKNNNLGELVYCCRQGHTQPVPCHLNLHSGKECDQKRI